MNTPRIATAVVLCAGLATACGGPKNLRLAMGPALAEAPSSVGLAQPLLLLEQERLEPMDAFHRGYLVGNIWFTGGYELMPEEDNQVRSVGVEIKEVEPYATQVRQVVGDSFARLLGEHQIAWQPIETSVERAVRPPRQTPLRGSGPFDGHDNQNLPRFELQPQPLDVGELPELPPGTATVLVPTVVQYYTHNGGWFVGQNMGCSAGARMRVIWSLHDATDGRVLTWGDVGVQHQQEYYYSPNSAELQDYQLIVEAELNGWLDEQLPRRD